MSAKWRLLEIGETIQVGDQWHDHKTNLWCFAHQGVGDAVQTIDGPIRRRLTPAEEHAEELLTSLKELIGWINDAETCWLAHREYQVIDYKAYAVIAKAEGRQP